MNLTLLKKIGQIALKATELILGFGPAAVKYIPGDKDDKILAAITPELVQIAQVIQQVEVFGQALGLPGAQKLTAAAPSVAQIILASAIMAKHEIANPALFQAGCTQVAAGMADVLNSLKPDVETENKA